MDKRVQGLLGQVDRKEQQFVIGEHFSRPDHDKSDIKVQVVEVAKSKLSWDREASKIKWMKKLNAQDVGTE